MIVCNQKMKSYLPDDYFSGLPNGLDLSFSKLGEGYFFTNFLGESTKKTIDDAIHNEKFDWMGYEYTMNKIHLECELEGSIAEVTRNAASFIGTLSRAFHEKYPEVEVFFILGSDEFSEFPSVTLTFYVNRIEVIPILELPVTETTLDAFHRAVLVSS